MPDYADRHIHMISRVTDHFQRMADVRACLDVFRESVRQLA